MFAHSVVDVITLIIFDEAYKLWGFSLRTFPHFPFTFSILGPDILLSAHLLMAINHVPPHPYKTTDIIHIKTS
jgi:hypothetical protein